MDNNARLMFLLNYMQSNALKKFLHSICSRDEFRTAIYDLPYLNPKEGSLFTHVLDVGYIVRAIWEMKEKSLNYDYLVVGSLLHEYKKFDEDIPSEITSWLSGIGVCENAISLIIDVIIAPTANLENVLTTKTAEAVIIRHAKECANYLAICDTEKDVKDGQRFFVDYPAVPIFTKPIVIS